VTNPPHAKPTRSPAPRSSPQPPPYYHDSLVRWASVAAYLKGPERGLHADTIDSRLIGYAPMEITYDVTTGTRTIERPRHLYAHLITLGYRPSDIIATGVCQDHDGRIIDSLAGMITIPYLVAGQVVTIRGRTWPHTDADFATWEFGSYTPPKGKYKTLGGTSARLYGTDAVWTNKEVCICEGEFDALILEQIGYPRHRRPRRQRLAGRMGRLPRRPQTSLAHLRPRSRRRTRRHQTPRTFRRQNPPRPPVTARRQMRPDVMVRDPHRHRIR
jgi:hypothetical protein